MFATSDMIRQWNENGKGFVKEFSGIGTDVPQPGVNYGPVVSVGGVIQTWDHEKDGVGGYKEIELDPKIYTVGTTGRYQTLQAAIQDISGQSANKRALIKLLDPSYTIVSQINLPDYVDIVGCNSAYSEIVLNLPDSATEAQIEATSCFLLTKNNTLSRLNIHGKNIRYAIHIDGCDEYSKQKIVDCTVKHDGITASLVTWSACAALGCGTTNGQEIELKRVDASGWIGKSTAGHAFSVHNSTAIQTVASHVSLSDCTLDVYGSSNPGNGASVSVQSIADGVMNLFEMNDCVLNGVIEDTKGGTSYSACRWKYRGSGNSTMGFYSEFGTAYFDPTVTRRVYNDTDIDIPDGYAVSHGYIGIVYILSRANIAKFCGVASGKIPARSYGTIIVRGGAYTYSSSGASYLADMQVSAVSGVVEAGSTYKIGVSYFGATAGGRNIMWLTENKFC